MFWRAVAYKRRCKTDEAQTLKIDQQINNCAAHIMERWKLQPVAPTYPSPEKLRGNSCRDRIRYKPPLAK
jgi:hypothetical protein